MVWCSVRAIAQQVVLPSRWYPTVMHRCGCQQSSFLSKLTIFCILNTAWIFGVFMHNWVMEQRKAVPTNQLR